MQREFSAGGVLVRRLGGRWHVAAIRPRREDHLPQVWALPKGHIDGSETGAQAAVREVHEETGIEGRVEAKLGDVRYFYMQTWGEGRGERIFKIVSFFLLRPVRGRLGEIAPEMEIEVAEVRWLPLDDAPQLLAYKGERDMTVKAKELLGDL